MFSPWMKFLDTSFPGESLKRSLSLTMMNSSARTFEDWRNVFFRVAPGSDLERRAFFKMSCLAVTFGQWVNVCQECSSEHPLREHALRCAMALADNPTDVEPKKREGLKLSRWLKIHRISLSGSATEDLAEEKIMLLLRNAKRDDKPLDPCKI